MKIGQWRSVRSNSLQLRIQNPKPWWPRQMGDPHLERLTVSFRNQGEVTDEQSVDFGFREITSELTANGSRLFRVNGKPILIRGAGWSQDMLLRTDETRLRDQFQLVQDMNLNTIRLEGKLETEEFFHLADERGILVMLGWCCCDHWEHWKDWTPRGPDHCHRIAAFADAAPAPSRQPAGVAERQRQCAARQCGARVSGC